MERCLRKRGELDGNKELMDFADRLEEATIRTIEEGKMTKDLALITTMEDPTVLNSEGFIKQSLRICKSRKNREKQGGIPMGAEEFLNIEEEHKSRVSELLQYCLASGRIDQNLYQEYDVKRGLRDSSGKVY